jgi:hypothetical protein
LTIEEMKDATGVMSEGDPGRRTEIEDGKRGATITGRGGKIIIIQAAVMYGRGYFY